MDRKKLPKEVLEHYQLNQKQMDKVFDISIKCVLDPTIRTKADVINYIESHAGDTRTAIAAAMYVGARLGL